MITNPTALSLFNLRWLTERVNAAAADAGFPPPIRCVGVSGGSLIHSWTWELVHPIFADAELIVYLAGVQWVPKQHVDKISPPPPGLQWNALEAIETQIQLWLNAIADRKKSCEPPAAGAGEPASEAIYKPITAKEKELLQIKTAYEKLGAMRTDWRETAIVKAIAKELFTSPKTIHRRIQELRKAGRLPPRLRKPKELSNRMTMINPTRQD